LFYKIFKLEKEEKMLSKTIFTAILINFVLFSQTNIPSDVANVLEKAGENRSELEKVIEHYSENESDSLKLKAAYFLIGNMDKQFYTHFVVTDSTGRDMHFNVLDYPDYKTMVRAWDSLEAIYGPIENRRDTTVYDYEIITAKYLIENIDLAFEARKFPWAQHISFDEFCEYILPYRGTNEPLENWRKYFFEKYNWLADSVKDKTDPVEACIIINNDLRTWFKFDSRFYRHYTDQSLSEMLKNKAGRCEDMTNLAIYAMRANGVPVTSDFTPYWAKTGNNHAWNTVISKSGKPVIFMGGLTNPYEYELGQALAKVYRKTFARQKNSLAEIKPEYEKAPPYINRNNIIDVTSDYVKTANVFVKLSVPKPDSVNFAYICVFNSGEWKAINWGKILQGNSATFKDMGLDIAYLPAYYKNEKIIPAGAPFILSEKGELIPLVANEKYKRKIKLYSTTKKTTKNATDNIEKAFFTKGKKYELFYWENGWKSLGKKTAGDGALEFSNVPQNALLWLVEENSHKDERIFTIDENGKQIWW